MTGLRRNLFTTVALLAFCALATAPAWSIPVRFYGALPGSLDRADASEIAFNNLFQFNIANETEIYRMNYRSAAHQTVFRADLAGMDLARYGVFASARTGRSSGAADNAGEAASQVKSILDVAPSRAGGPGGARGVFGGGGAGAAMPPGYFWFPPIDFGSWFSGGGSDSSGTGDSTDGPTGGLRDGPGSHVGDPSPGPQAAVPEPGTIWLMGLGGAVLALARRFRR